MSRLMTKPTKWLCAQRRQISLDIRPVWSESSLSTWRKAGPLATHWVHNPGWSESSLGTQSFCWFCHEVDHILLFWASLQYNVILHGSTFSKYQKLFIMQSFSRLRKLRIHSQNSEKEHLLNLNMSRLMTKPTKYCAPSLISLRCLRRTDKMRICVFHSNLNVKNPIIFGNVRIMYAKHFPDTQLCPVSKRICFVYISNGMWTASDVP